MKKIIKWKTKAFTLVELIVVITILAILWTISFISFQNYSKEARDAKRMTDVRNLLTKLNVEQASQWYSYKEMLKNPSGHKVEINWDDTIDAYQWILDFELLRESRNNFQDPETKGNYDFATAKWKAEYNWKEQW